MSSERIAVLLPMLAVLLSPHMHALAATADRAVPEPFSAGLDDGPGGRVLLKNRVIDCDRGAALTLWDK